MQGSLTGVVFPGQGAQREGMFRDWHERYSIVRSTFEEASTVLDIDLRKLCFENDSRRDQTEYTQPALLVGEVAMYRALSHEFGVVFERFAGHSVGEYTALTVAGALPFSFAVELVRKRGKAMQSAVPIGQGGMIVINAPNEEAWDVVMTVAARYALDVASFNASDQRVFAGTSSALGRMEAEVKQLLPSHSCEVIRLNVSAPFHSRWMEPVERELRSLLADAADRLSPQRAEVVMSNATGAWYSGQLTDLIGALSRQAVAPVLWLDNMRALGATCTTVLEVGPSRPLSGLFRRIGQEIAAITHVQSAERRFRS